jgi:LacI family transcriptional regulator
MVAEKAGVSVATVSRSLHDDPAVVPETRRRVLRVCDELGYVPSLAGRRLKQGVKAVVGLSLGSQDHAVGRYVSLMHRALSQQLALSGWSVELIRSRDFHEGLSVGGLILLGVLTHDSRLDALRGSGLPIVSIGHDERGFHVAPDDAAGARLAVAHLLGLGRRRLAILHSHDVNHGISLRARAAIEAARDAGVEPIVFDFDPSTTPTLQGYRAMARAMAAGAAFDGLFCETDELAIGAVTALEDAGRNVPGQVAVVGFDDLPEFAERLTTIKQDIPRIAAAAIDLLAKARRGDKPRAVLLPVELIKRETA